MIMYNIVKFLLIFILTVGIIGWAGAFHDKQALLMFFGLLLAVSDFVFFFLVGLSFDLVNAILDSATAALAARQYSMIPDLNKC